MDYQISVYDNTDLTGGDFIVVTECQVSYDSVGNDYRLFRYFRFSGGSHM